MGDVKMHADGFQNGEVKKMIASALREVMQESNVNPKECAVCKFETAQHQTEHEALRRVISFFDKLEETRWGIYRKVAWILALATISSIVYGLKAFFLGGS
jgi:hypothetical protein